MEWWILLALVLLILVVGATNRVIRARRRSAEKEVNNMYPLW